jgi:hypothetical protein
VANELPTTDADGPRPATNLLEWVNGTRDRLATESPPIAARPPRNIPKWVLALLLVVSVGMGWLAWNSCRAPTSAEVVGMVRDIHGKAVADALVFLIANPTIETRTHSDGSFRLTLVPSGSQVLLIVQEDMGEEYAVRAKSGTVIDLGDLVYRVPPRSVRRGPGSGADWGK